MEIMLAMLTINPDEYLILIYKRKDLVIWWKSLDYFKRFYSGLTFDR